MLVASAIGAGSAVTGLSLAYYGDFTPGASIVLVAIGAHVAAMVVSAVRDRVGQNAPA